jgi:hypothetical protein
VNAGLAMFPLDVSFGGQELPPDLPPLIATRAAVD